MKNIRFYETSKPAASRLRIAAAGMLFLAAAALAANLIMPPRLPWAVPTVTVGNNPVGITVDAARHTIYVANALDDTVSVIDSNKCNSRNSSHCTTIATITVGPVPFYLAFDPTTDTIYATLPGPDFDNNTVAVINGATCNATNTSGCGQTPAI
jgi:DNA-binding beta-propeller fold protein YncE